MLAGAGLVVPLTVPAVPRNVLAENPYVSCAYYDSGAVAVVADSHVVPVADDAVRTRVWEMFRAAPPPLGFDPAAIGVPGWDAPTAPGFVVARMDPWRVQVRHLKPGVGVELETWRDPVVAA